MSDSRFTDIREMARKQFDKALEEVRNSFYQARFVIIVDTHSIPILSSLFTMTELMSRNITLAETYEKPRQPILSQHAIYFLSSGSDLSIFINDFHPKPKYAAPHLFFTYECSESNKELLMSRNDVFNRIQSFYELYIEFKPIDPSFFTVTSPTAFNSLFSETPRVPKIVTYNEIVKGLVSFFFTAKTRPEIAYLKNDENSSQIASIFNDQYSAVLESIGSEKSSFSSENTLLLILPRNIDLIAPLLHQFSYQAMIQENLDVQNDSVTIQPTGTQVHLNVYEDPVFKHLRYTHYVDAIDYVEDCRKKITQLEKEVEALPKTDESGRPNKIYKEKLKEKSQQKLKHDLEIAHFYVLDALNTCLREKDLFEISKWEQCLVTGVGEDGSNFKPDQTALSTKLASPKFSEIDKLRLIALYQIVTGNKIKDRVLELLMKNNSIEQRWVGSVYNLKCLQSLDKRSDKMRKGDRLVTDKYYPYIAEIVEKADGCDLPSDFRSPSRSKSQKYTNIVVFVVGGITYGELNSINELVPKLKCKSLVVGSTSTLTPRQFLAQIKGLKQVD